MSDTDNVQDQITKIQKAIEQTEALRDLLPADQIETMLAGLKTSLAQFQAQLIGSGAIAQSGSTAIGAGGVNVGGNTRDVNTGIILNNNKYAGKDPQDEAEARRIYLDVLSLMVSHLPLGAFDANEANPNAAPQRVQLADVFIRLDTTKQVAKKADEPEPTTLVGRIKRKLAQLTQSVVESRDVFRREDMRPLRLFEAVAKSPWLVITGEPGSGKSTAVNYLIWCLARGQADPSTELPEIFMDDWTPEKRDLTPLRVILRDFEVWLRDQPATATGPALLTDFMAHTLRQQNLAFATAWLDQQTEAGKALVVLDGLDEVTTIAARVRVCEAIRDFARRYRHNHYLVTCRTLSYQEPEIGNPDLRLNTNEFPAFEIAGLDDPKIKDFVEAWHAELTRVGKITNEARATYLRDRLWKALQQSDLKRLARNPLQLTLMAWVHTDNDELPDKRAKLYDKAVELLLWKWESQKQYRDARETLGDLALKISDGRGAIERQLRRAAYTAHGALAANADAKTSDALADVDEADLQHELAKLKKDPLTFKGDENWARDVIDAIKNRSGLLARRGENKLTFPHRTFQEFLAGLRMLENPAFVEEALEKSAARTLWREPILLAIGYSVFKQERRDLALPLMLARRLCNDHCADDELRWQRVWLAGEVLREINPDDARDKDAGTHREVQTKLTELVTTGQLTPAERARAGSVLARIGDPRFDPERYYLPKGADTLLGFIDIPAGPFYMGTRKADLDTLLQKSALEKVKDVALDVVTLGKHSATASEYAELWPDDSPMHLPRFLIARYPTTVAQFRAFVGATGFKLKDEDALRDDDTDPVRYVTWHEALAYCDWLHEVLKHSPHTPEPLRALITEQGWRVTLPSEAEWEKAARGPVEDNPLPRRLYPWGDQTPSRDNNDLANLGYANVNTTSVVGAFPLDGSPYGCRDLAGNVWEWTRSLYGKDWNKPEFVYPYMHRQMERENLAAGNEVLRVVRGGAFNDDEWHARCASRDRYLPDDPLRVNFIGFRVVVSPFLFDTDGR